MTVLALLGPRPVFRRSEEIRSDAVASVEAVTGKKVVACLAAGS